MPSIRALGNSFLSASSGSSPLPTAPLDQQTAASPNQGPMSGGTRVTIIGHHLSGATSVHFGSQAAWSFTVPNDTTIIAVSPAGAGNVPVTVTTAGGTGTLGWFFYQPVPGLKSLQPASGPVGGGSVVVLTGSNLDTVQSVRFGSALAVPTEVANQRLTVVAPPASAPGTVPVTVTTAGGVSNAAPYTYTAEPIITGVFPATGGTAGGIPVLITGSGLARVTAVTIAGVPVSSLRANSDTLIVAVVPPGVAGAADVTVTTPGGQQHLARRLRVHRSHLGDGVHLPGRIGDRPGGDLHRHGRPHRDRSRRPHGYDDVRLR
ncbi:IPT/TIG domain-containing protein [Streptomyces anandii]|uniref:IPT/TIG domain-containing protein n=1 Tax=Streptomyces anandii TaxID=285454 RepID=UPI00369CD9D5